MPKRNLKKAESLKKEDVGGLNKITLKTKEKIRLLFDKGWTAAKIQKKYPRYTIHQVAAVRGWMKRGAY